MLLIGVTGPIASGKTNVCNTFCEMGALLIDADKIGHEVLERPSNRVKLLEHFGEDVICDNGTVNRERIAEIVFSNPETLEWLEKLIHPPLVEEILHKIRELKESGFPGVIVLDAAMLPKWPEVLNQLDYLIMLQSPIWQRTNRLVQERGYQQDHSENRISAQEALFNTLTPHLDFIIKNNGDLQELRAKALRVWLEIKHGPTSRG